MSDYGKAVRILSVLVRYSREAAFIPPEDVIEKCRNTNLLEIYYRRLCENVR